ncbi:MAG: DUF2586 family protein [Pseudomonadota bacterium]
MYPPGQTITVRDGGVGNNGTPTSLPLVIGVTSLGSANKLYQFSDPNLLKDTLGRGPAVEFALACLLSAGAVMVLKTAASTAGINSSVAKSPVGSSTGTITLSGTPLVSMRARVEIRTTGTLGTGKFRYSLDGGYTFSADRTIPAGGTFTIPGTGVTATFVPGAGAVFFEAGDVHTWTSTAPHYTTSDIAAAMGSNLRGQLGARSVRRVFAAGKNASASAAATMAAAFATEMAALEANFYYARLLMDAGEDSTSNARSAFGAFADPRVAVAYGNADVVSLDSFEGFGVGRYPAALPISERAAGTDLSENIGRFLSGPLRGVVAITHDERTATAFSEDDRIITLRSEAAAGGFYVTNGYLKSAAGSDFSYLDWGYTLDEALSIVQRVQNTWKLRKVRVLADGTGRIDPRDARTLEQEVLAPLNAALKRPLTIEGFNGHVSDLSYTIDREHDVLTTKTIRSSLGLVPLPPIEGVETVAGFARAVTV